MTSCTQRRRKFIYVLQGARGAPQIPLLPGSASLCVSEAPPGFVHPQNCPTQLRT